MRDRTKKLELVREEEAYHRAAHLKYILFFRFLIDKIFLKI